MTQFIIKGKADHVSREAVRAWLWASLTILGYHNLLPATAGVLVRIRRKVKNNCQGLATRSTGEVELRADLHPQAMFTTILHEMIHICADFPDGTEEACTSTLCSRLKQDVSSIAHYLVHNTYKRAAAIAHCKISYPPRNGQEDFYNPQEDVEILWRDKYDKKRKKTRQNA